MKRNDDREKYQSKVGRLIRDEDIRSYETVVSG